jgi:hypothetical protein
MCDLGRCVGDLRGRLAALLHRVQNENGRGGPRASNEAYQLHLQVYVQVVNVTNQLSTSVDASIRASAAARYSVHPKNLRLKPGQSCEVELKLKLVKYAAVEKAIVQGQRDTFHIKTQLSDQQFSATFYLDPSLGAGHKHDGGTAAELDPLGGDASGTRGLRLRGSSPPSRASHVQSSHATERAVQVRATNGGIVWHYTESVGSHLSGGGLCMLKQRLLSSCRRAYRTPRLQKRCSHSSSSKRPPAPLVHW